MKTSTLITIVLSAIVAVSGFPEAFAKGGDDNPVVAILDENGNTVKIDPAHNDVDVGSLPAVKIDPSQNDVDANVTNEVEIKNDNGFAILVDTGAMARTPFAVHLIDSNFSQSMHTSFDVPADSILVIENVAAKLQATGNGPRTAWTSLTTGGILHHVDFNIHTQPGLSLSGYPRYVVNQPLRLYADADSKVYFQAVSESGASIIGSVSISGYLVPVGDPSLAP